MENLVETRLYHAYRADDRPHEEAEADPTERPYVELRDSLEELVGNLSRLSGKFLCGDSSALALLLADGRNIGKLVFLGVLNVRDHRI